MMATMNGIDNDLRLVPLDALILVTGATGFIGSRWGILDRGFRNLRCFVRPSAIHARSRRPVTPGARRSVRGNLCLQEDCAAAARMWLVFHLAAGRAESSRRVHESVATRTF